MKEITLHEYWRSSACYRVRIALNLAKIRYKIIAVDLLKGEHRLDAHLARQPQGIVPVLEIYGQQSTQLLAIIEYINEIYNLGLLPEQTADKTKVRALAQTLAIDVHPVCNLTVKNFAVELSGWQETRPIWIKSFTEPGLKAFETLLGAFEQSPYCTGSEVSMADICLMPQINNATGWGAVFNKYPRIVSVVRACDLNPAFIKAHPKNVKVS